MTGIIVALPKPEDAKNLKNLLMRNGISVTGACTTGAQAIALADGLNEGIIICGYKLADMLYSQIQECIPPGFEILLLASHHIIGSGMIHSGIMCLSMPFHIYELVNTIETMMLDLNRRQSRKKPVQKKRTEQEQRIIEDAKQLLMERNHLSEIEAHKYIQKLSMDSGNSLVETAEMILVLD